MMCSVFAVRRAWVLGAAVWALGGALGCSTAGSELGRGAEAPPNAASARLGDVEREPSASVVPPPAAPAASEAAPKPAPRSVHYDLLAHPEAAELRHRATLILDMGAHGDAKYTLGGWGTRMLPGPEVEGASTAAVRGSYGEVLLPVDFEGAGWLRVRARAPRDGALRVSLDGKVLTNRKEDAAQLGTLSVSLSPDQLGPGEHRLGLQGTGMGRVGALQTGVLVDWIAIGPDDEAPPPIPTLGLNEAGVQVLPAAFSLAHALRVPEAAQLEVELEAGTGELELTAVRDDLSRTALGSVPAGRAQEVDLSALAGQLVRLELRARGDVAIRAAAVSVPERPLAAARPVKNVIVYLIDTLRADHLKAFNPDTRVRTPGLDGLVELGSRVFTQAHTQENWTKPSVATLLSSLMPWEHNAVTTEAVVPSSVQLLPELLSERGFYTGAFIANGYVSDKFGFKQGWNDYRNYIREGRPTRAKFLAADVMEWLDKRPQEKPFFLYVHAIDPHVPYRPTRQFMALYDPLPYHGVVSFGRDHELLEKVKIGKIRLGARDKQHLEALYDSEISYHDLHFATLASALEKRGLSDDTMIVVVSDHGEEFWDHGSVGHGHSVYEELLHIPMVMRVPGLTEGVAKIESPAGLVDVMPTVLEALGQELPEGLSGRSLLPELRGGAPDAPRTSVSGFMDGWRALIASDLKLVQRTYKRVMLYDLAADPGEQTDVSAERPLSVRYLRGQLGLVLAATEPGQPSPTATGKRRHRREKTDIDAETEAQLRALGYVGTSRP